VRWRVREYILNDCCLRLIELKFQLPNPQPFQCAFEVGRNRLLNGKNYSSLALFCIPMNHELANCMIDLSTVSIGFHLVNFHEFSIPPDNNT
jgi:hypothetical protein